MSNTVGELEYDEKEALNLGASYGELNEENVEKEYIDEIENLKVAGDIELNILNKAGNKEYRDDDELGEEEEDLDSIQLEARIIGKKIKELMNPEDGSHYMVLIRIWGNIEGLNTRILLSYLEQLRTGQKPLLMSQGLMEYLFMLTQEQDIFKLLKSELYQPYYT